MRGCAISTGAFPILVVLIVLVVLVFLVKSSFGLFLFFLGFGLELGNHYGKVVHCHAMVGR